jgi:hypothetical protein
MRERREGKVQILLLRERAFQARGYSRRSAHRCARHEVRAMLAERVECARALLDPGWWTGPSRLRTGLACMLDVALRLYVPRLLAVDGFRHARDLSTGCQEATPLERLA